MTRLEHLLSDAADRFGNDPAVISANDVVTYAELEEMALGFARRLREEGVSAADNVAIRLPNSVAFLAAFFGVQMTGAIAVCISPHATPRELAGIMEISSPRAAVCARGGDAGPDGGELERILPEHVLWIDDRRLARPEWKARDRSEIVARDPDSAALVAFTSGSTGRAKGALIRAVTLVRTGKYFLDLVLDGRRTTTVATFPLYHVGGMAMTVFPIFLGGGALVVMDGFDVGALLSAIEHHKVEFVPAIPAMMELVFLRAKLSEHDVSTVRSVFLGGAPVSNGLACQIAERLDAVVYVGYGQTECPGLWMSTRSDTPVSEVGPFVGWPVDGYELAVMDEEGRCLPPGTTGEVCVRSHYQMIEYLGDPDATAAAVDAEGWLHTGDLGEVRPDGGLVIQGRKKEMYIRGGYNVYPREVEEALMEHPAVSLVAVHGVTDDVLGERGCAWVVPEPGSSLEPGALREYCQDALTYYKVPDVIRVVDELPVTAIGKIDKLELRARAEAEYIDHRVQ